MEERQLLNNDFFFLHQTSKNMHELPNRVYSLNELEACSNNMNVKSVWLSQACVKAWKMGYYLSTVNKTEK